MSGSGPLQHRDAHQRRPHLASQRQLEGAWTGTATFQSLAKLNRTYFMFSRKRSDFERLDNRITFTLLETNQCKYLVRSF